MLPLLTIDYIAFSSHQRRLFSVDERSCRDLELIRVQGIRNCGYTVLKAATVCNSSASPFLKPPRASWRRKNSKSRRTERTAGKPHLHAQHGHGTSELTEGCCLNETPTKSSQPRSHIDGEETRKAPPSLAKEPLPGYGY